MANYGQEYKPNFTLGESGPLKTTKRFPTANIGSIPKGASLGSKALKIGGEVGKSLIPYLDTGLEAMWAYNDFKTGHPWRGAGHAGMAAINGAIDTAAVLGDIFTAGAATPADHAAAAATKAGIKIGAKKAATKAMQWAMRQRGLKPSLTRMVADIGLEIGKDDGNTKQAEQPKTVVSNTNNVKRSGSGSRVYPQGYGNTTTLPNGQQVDINSIINPNSVGKETMEQPEQQIDNSSLDKLLDYYNQQKELRKPYLEALQEYANNYQDYQRRAFNMDRYLAGIAGWSGNDNFARMIGRYNPATVEATRLDLLNKLAQEQVNELDLGNKAIGNASLLQEAGLSPNAAFADPNMIKSIATIMNAKTAADARRYAADQLYKARVYDTQLDNMIKRELGLRRNENARYLTQLREQNRYNIAQLQAQAYGYGGNVAGALQQLPLQ